MGRLFQAGIVMAIGSGVMTYLFPTGTGISNNIFFSLGLGVALMSVSEWIRDTDDYLIGILGILFLSIASLFTEAGIYGLAMVTVFYLFRHRRDLLALFYTVGSLLPPLLIGPLTLERLLFHDYQWMMVFALPLLFLYNGELGRGGPIAKWFFYIFYPAHIWTLYFISYRIS